MRAMESKEKLMQTFYNFKSDDVKKVDVLIRRIKRHLEKEPDVELSFILHILASQQADNNCQSFEKCCEIAYPIFKHLDSVNKWGYLELYVLSMAIAYHTDYNKTLDIFRKALDLLDEKCAEDKEYNYILINMHCTILLRMIRANYLDPAVDKATLNADFERSYNYVMEVCERRNLLQKYSMLVRRGILEHDLDMINNAIAELRKSRNIKRYKDARDEVAEYIFYMDVEFDKEWYDFSIGYLITKRRSELGCAVEDFADMMNIDINTVYAIERGDGGISTMRLRQIAKLLEVHPGYFFGAAPLIEKTPDIHSLQFARIINGATDEEKASVLQAAKFAMKLMRKYKE